MHVHNFRQNEFCSRCECTKVRLVREKTLPNMSADPSTHSLRTFTQEELDAFSPLFRMPGMCIARVMHDVAHSQYLGSGKLCNGRSEVKGCGFSRMELLFVLLSEDQCSSTWQKLGFGGLGHAARTKMRYNHCS